MSQIDKLVNKAFPDELRHVEPVDVDEDAILALTMEKLGLGQDQGAQPVKGKGILRGRGKRQEEKLVAVPLVAVRRRWVDRIGIALAACLVLTCGVYWGPWLLHNLGFGSRAPASQGGYTGADAPQGGTDEVQAGGVKVVIGEAETAGRGFTLKLMFFYQDGNTPVDTRELSLYDISVTDGAGQAFPYNSRANRSGTVNLVFDSWDQQAQQAPFTVVVNRLAAVEDGGGIYWEEIGRFTVTPGGVRTGQT